jgi:hypothetical protein
MTDTIDVNERAARIFAGMVREAEEREQAEERVLARQRLGNFLALEAFIQGDSPHFVNPPAETSPDGRPPEVCAQSRIAKLERVLEYAQTHELTDSDREALRRAGYEHAAWLNTLREHHGWSNRKEYRKAAKVFDALEALVGKIEPPNPETI